MSPTKGYAACSLPLLNAVFWLMTSRFDKSRFCLNHGAIQTNIETLVSESNLISLHVPLTTLTKDMVDENFLSKIKSDAYLINTSRGGIVNEKELKKALEQKKLLEPRSMSLPMNLQATKNSSAFLTWRVLHT